MEKEHPPILPQIERFLQEYAIDLNGRHAAIRAGYSAKYADTRASMLLAKPHVRKRLTEILAERMVRTHVAQDRVVEELTKLAMYDVRKLFREDGTLKPVGEWDVSCAAAVTGIEVTEIYKGSGPGRREKIGEVKKVKLASRHEAIVTLMKHMGLLTDRVVVSGDKAAPIQHETTVKHSLADAVAAVQLKRALT